MASTLFPSGPWVGFYTYLGSSRQFLMDLKLEFVRGLIHGDGADGIGFFIIAGHYDEKTRDCSWTKTYVGHHTVCYRGFREGKGIWGTWTLSGGSGGFHIWPLKQGPPPGARFLKEEEEQEVDVPALPRQR